MVYSDISHQFGSLSLEAAYQQQHQQQHQAYQHLQQQQHQPPYQPLHHIPLGSLGMEPVQNSYSQQQAGAESPSTASSEIKSQNNQNAIVVPPEEAILKLCDRTKYQIIQENGQRRYGPPPDWRGTPPNRGCEVFIGKIPRDCFEDELVPIFEKVGRIYMFRLMMDFSGSNRGYGFCIYTNREDTKRAVQKLDNYEIRKGKTLGVCLSVDNCRLFVGGIPKTKAKHEIMTEMRKITDGVKDVIVYPSAADKGKNRGFAFVEYEHHKAAAMARRKLIPGRIQLWGHQIAVDWAEPEREVDEDIMSKVKILYVRNLMLNTTEEHLRDLFAQAAGSVDCVERVKKIRDYAFVHFRDRNDALEAMEKLDETEIDGSRVEVTLAKPVDKAESARAKTAAAVAAAAAGQQKLQPVGQLGAFAQLGLPQPAAGGLFQQLAAGGAAIHSLEPLTMAAYCQGGNGGLQLGSQETGQAPARPFRNAAGSRSAGARNSTLGHSRDKKGHLELLDEICSRNCMGAPSYHVQSHELLDTSTGAKSNWFFGKVTINSPTGPRQYTSHRFTQTTEEAKVAAAESALLQLTQQQQQQQQLQQQQHQAAVAAANSASGNGGGGGGLFANGDPGQAAAFLGELGRIQSQQQQQQQQQQQVTQQQLVSYQSGTPVSITAQQIAAPAQMGAPLQLATYATSPYPAPLFATYGGQQMPQQLTLHQQQIPASNMTALPLAAAAPSAGPTDVFPTAFLYAAAAHNAAAAAANGSMMDPGAAAAYFAAAAAMNGAATFVAAPHHAGPPAPPPLAGTEIYAHYVN